MNNLSAAAQDDETSDANVQLVVAAVAVQARNMAIESLMAQQGLTREEAECAAVDNDMNAQDAVMADVVEVAPNQDGDAETPNNASIAGSIGSFAIGSSIGSLGESSDTPLTID